MMFSSFFSFMCHTSPVSMAFVREMMIAFLRKNGYNDDNDTEGLTLCLTLL